MVGNNVFDNYGAGGEHINIAFVQFLFVAHG
jgi:hypothetical protein